MKLITYRTGGEIRHGILRGPEGHEVVVDLGSGDLH